MCKIRNKEHARCTRIRRKIFENALQAQLSNAYEKISNKLAIFSAQTVAINHSARAKYELSIIEKLVIFEPFSMIFNFK